MWPWNTFGYQQGPQKTIKFLNYLLELFSKQRWILPQKHSSNVSWKSYLICDNTTKERTRIDEQGSIHPSGSHPTTRISHSATIRNGESLRQPQTFHRPLSRRPAQPGIFIRSLSSFWRRTVKFYLFPHTLEPKAVIKVEVQKYNGRK